MSAHCVSASMPLIWQLTPSCAPSYIPQGLLGLLGLFSDTAADGLVCGLLNPLIALITLVILRERDIYVYRERERERERETYV